MVYCPDVEENLKHHNSGLSVQPPFLKYDCKNMVEIEFRFVLKDDKLCFRKALAVLRK